jgi:predicted dehydrogenase
LKKIKVGVIGCGAVVELFYLASLKRLKSQIDVSYFVDMNEERAEKFAKKFNCKFTTDYKSISSQVDAAIIATPHHLHHPIGKYFLENGVHVLIEKPISNSTKEVEELISIAKEKSLIASAGNFRRYQDSMLWMKSFTKEMPLGKLMSFIAREGGKYNWPVTTNSFWDKKSAGGGVLIDTGAHTIDQVAMLCGAPISLEYNDNAIDNIETDCDVKFIYSDDVSGDVQLSRTIALGAGLLLKYEKGSLYLDLIGKRILSENDLVNQLKYNGHTIADLKVQDYVKLMERQLRHWSDAIQNNSSSYVSAEDVLPSIQIIETCYTQNNKA